MRSELENLRVSGPRDTFSKRLQIFGARRSLAGVGWRSV